MQIEDTGFGMYDCTILKAEPEKEPSPLSLHAREARRLGMSYGQYMSKYHPALPKKQGEEHNQSEYIKVCPYCHKTFKSNSKNAIYCSESCKSSFYYHRRKAGETIANRVQIEGKDTKTGEKYLFNSCREAERFLGMTRFGKLAVITKPGSPIEWKGYVWRRVNI